MKNKIRLFLFCVFVPLLVGGLSGFLTRGNMETYATLNRSPLTPPGSVFPVVWTILYILMGIASYLVLTSNAPSQHISKALKVYLLQLVVNFFWSIIFFNLEMYLFAFVWLVLLWILILITIIKFNKVSKPASYLLIPYFLWVTFAGYLNLTIYLLN